MTRESWTVTVERRAAVALSRDAGPAWMVRKLSKWGKDLRCDPGGSPRGRYRPTVVARKLDLGPDTAT